MSHKACLFLAVSNNRQFHLTNRARYAVVVMATRDLQRCYGNQGLCWHILLSCFLHTGTCIGWHNLLNHKYVVLYFLMHYISLRCVCCCVCSGEVKKSIYIYIILYFDLLDGRWMCKLDDLWNKMQSMKRNKTRSLLLRIAMRLRY